MNIKISPLKNFILLHEDKHLTYKMHSSNANSVSCGILASISIDDSIYNNTDKAQDLKRAQKIIETLPIVDTKRVASIKAAIQSGNYQVNSDVVARKIIAFDHPTIRNS